MNYGRRSIALQSRIRQLLDERARIDREIKRLRQDRARIVPRRPHTGCTQACLELLRERGKPMTSREIAAAITRFEIPLIQRQLSQAARCGRVTREAIPGAKAGPYACRFRFGLVEWSIASRAKDAA